MHTPYRAPYVEDDLLPLSGLAHIAFCERRWALVHLEQQWAENRFTTEGAHLHEKAHSGEVESRPGVLVRRTLPLRLLRLGLSGQADIVEFHPSDEPQAIQLAGRSGRWQPLPIEYKRSRDKAGSIAYRLQLCAQAMCLEEMLGASITVGAIFDGKARRAAGTYFSVLDHLILTDKNRFFYRGRSRRPPVDNVNALLSFLYTMLANDTVSALECVGLDPQVGFLHRERPGRPSLALDLMEEFRAMFADRLMLTLVNLRQVKSSGFQAGESGGVIMDDATRKEVLTQWHLRKNEEIVHPYLGERIPLGLLPYVQALLLARFLRGDLDGYPPFFWK